jgi:nucleotide-binding universal stress UspA family protein
VRTVTAGLHTVIVGLGEREGDDDAMALAVRLVDPDGGAVVPVHVHPPHRWARSPARGLIEAAEERGADLIALGPGRTAPDGRLAPSRTALQVLHGARCPVAVAPRAYRERGPFRHIGIAYDGTDEATAALRAGYGLAARDHAAVTLYWTIRDGRVGTAGMPSLELDKWTQQERRAAQDALDVAADTAPDGVNPETVLLRGDPGRDIIQESDGIVDLLVTGSRGLGPVQRALSGSVSEQLLLGASAPVLIVPRTAVPESPGG